MTRLRVVIDTNVLVSGLLSSTSVPARALESAVADGQVLVSPDTLQELMATLLSPKFDRYVPRADRDALLSRLAPLVEVVEVIQFISVCRDPRDDKFLDVAINGRADVLITGDQDLLVLHPFRRTDILKPADYLRRKAD